MIKIYKKNKLIASWCLYEGAQSAFTPVIMTLVFAPYFTKYVAATPLIGAIQWSHAIVLAGIILLFVAPVIGYISDRTARKRIWLITFTITCILASSLLWFAKPHTTQVYPTLMLVVVGLVSIEITHIMHNSLLSSIVARNQLSKVSGWSRGVGYLATLLSLGIVFYMLEYGDFAWMPFVSHSPERVRLCGPLVAVWFLVWSLPLYFNLEEVSGADKDIGIQHDSTSIMNLLRCLKEILALKEISYFLLASILYIDALNTLTVMGGIYCSSIFNISSSNLIIYGITMSVTAGLGAVSLGWLVWKLGEKTVLLCALSGLFLLITIIFILQTLLAFVACSVLASVAIGITYGASRSMLARLAPKDKVVEIFSIYAISGRVTSFLGPLIAGLIMQYYQNQAAGLIVVPLFILSGMLFLVKVKPVPEVFHT